MASMFAKALSSMLINVNAAVVNIAKDWNSNIDWKELREGWQIAADENKPIMCIVQKRKCPGCKHLKEVVRQSAAIEEASKDFVMIVLDVWEVENFKVFGGPDEQYAPRVVFFAPSGSPLRHIVNQHNSPKQFAYSSADALLRSMTVAKQQTSRDAHAMLRVG